MDTCMSLEPLCFQGYGLYGMQRRMQIRGRESPRRGERSRYYRNGGMCKPR